MFVFQFKDGRYLKDTGSQYIHSRRHSEYWGTSDPYFRRYAWGGEHTENFVTSDLNEAKVFQSKKSIQSSNAYSWGGTIHEVEVTLKLKK